MSDYIKREDVVVKLVRTFSLQAPTAMAIVEAIPAADVVERKTGKWIYKSLSFVGIYICSNCGESNYTERTKYCPNCGAAMKGE